MPPQQQIVAPRRSVSSHSHSHGRAIGRGFETAPPPAMEVDSRRASLPTISSFANLPEVRLSVVYANSSMHIQLCKSLVPASLPQESNYGASSISGNKLS